MPQAFIACLSGCAAGRELAGDPCRGAAVARKWLNWLDFWRAALAQHAARWAIASRFRSITLQRRGPEVGSKAGDLPMQGFCGGRMWPSVTQFHAYPGHMDLWQARISQWRSGNYRAHFLAKTRSQRARLRTSCPRPQRVETFLDVGPKTARAALKSSPVPCFGGGSQSPLFTLKIGPRGCATRAATIRALHTRARGGLPAPPRPYFWLPAREMY